MTSSIESPTRQALAAPTLVGVRPARSDSADACQMRTRTGQYISFVTFAATSRTPRRSSDDSSGHDSSNSPSSSVGFTYPGGSPEVDPAHEGSRGSYGSDEIGESGVSMRSLSDDASSDAGLGDGSD
eukprot:1409301-Pleurochrysis_carterae.AAC.1